MSAARGPRDAQGKDAQGKDAQGNRVVTGAFLTSVGVAIAKFVAWLLSGSAAMLAEAMHSAADASSQLLLIVGRGAKSASDGEHPIGYRRDRHIWSFVVALVLFSLGGVYSIVLGIQRLQEPRSLDVPWLPLTVLGIALVLTALSLRSAVKEASQVRADAGWARYLRTSTSPELPVVVLQSFATLVGLVVAIFAIALTLLTGNSFFDAIGALLVGALMILVTIPLAFAMQSLQVGKRATQEEERRILDAFNESSEVEAVIHMKALALGQEELLVAAKVAFPPQSTLESIARAIDDLESQVRVAVPAARVVYIEPDIYVDRPDVAPSTDHIVIQSGN